MSTPINRWLFVLAVPYLLISAHSSLGSTLILTGQNEARYARGVDQQGNDYNYFDNYLSINADYNRFRINVRQTFRLPSEFDSYWQFGVDALDKMAFEYNDANFTLVGGDFYRYWGRGLLFGASEIVEINYDNGLQGLLLEGRYGNFEGAVFKGVELDTSGLLEESAEGLWLSSWLTPSIQVGASVSHLDSVERHPSDLFRYGFETNALIGSGSYYFVYTSDELDRDPAIFHHGFYGSASYYGSGWGLLVDYKHYSLLNYEGNLGNNSLQFAPTALPEATMYILDRHPRQLRYGNDVGGQIELTHSWNGWNNKLNYYVGSQQKDYSWLPTLEEEESPYQGLFLNAERDLDNGDHLVILGGFQEDVQFTPTAVGGFSNWYRRWATGVHYEHQLSRYYTVGAELELMNVDHVGADENFWEEYLALYASRSPVASVTLILEHSEDPFEQLSQNGITRNSLLGDGSQARLWPSVELTLNPTNQHQARIFWGHERGGLKCSGGICRWVNPFKGVKIVMTSYF